MASATRETCAERQEQLDVVRVAPRLRTGPCVFQWKLTSGGLWKTKAVFFGQHPEPSMVRKLPWLESFHGWKASMVGKRVNL